MAQRRTPEKSAGQAETLTGKGVWGWEEQNRGATTSAQGRQAAGQEGEAIEGGVKQGWRPITATQCTLATTR